MSYTLATPCIAAQVFGPVVLMAFCRAPVHELLNFDPRLWAHHTGYDGRWSDEQLRPRVERLGLPAAGKSSSASASFARSLVLDAKTGGAVAAVDVDPPNGGDIEAVRDVLARLNVRIFAEVATPSGGRHFYVAGHPQLSVVHSSVANEKLPGYPGVDIPSLGCNVSLPGTRRSKYGGRGYWIVFDDLDSLLAHSWRSGQK